MRIWDCAAFAARFHPETIYRLSKQNKFEDMTNEDRRTVIKDMDIDRDDDDAPCEAVDVVQL